MNAYPFHFEPIYHDKIWGGRNLRRLFGRDLPDGNIGESWELADIEQGVSVVANGPAAGTSLTDLTRQMGRDLLGAAAAWPGGRFPLLLKLLDASDILSLQVHPDERAVKEIGPPAALKTECWFVLDSRRGFIYKGVTPGVDAAAFRKAIEADACEEVCNRYDVAVGDFHYLPAGTVHALGAGVVVAEVQTPSDTTYRVTDWGRGREIHVERSMQCIRFAPSAAPPGNAPPTLLATPYFSVALRRISGGGTRLLPSGRCAAVMFLGLEGDLEVIHDGPTEPAIPARAGETLLIPAALKNPAVRCSAGCAWLEITLPEQR
ncbi:MAG: class I mannose-6-phosphate isomerase [Planctomycetaceae bacterium]|nr:class I mannose-6-phosphate isomerase [Planctomycetaceae bacterium]